MKLSDGIAREALVVIAGAVLAAWLVGQAPELRDWIARQWQPTRRGPSCGC